MSAERISAEELDGVRSGLRMANPPDPAALSAEKEMLTALSREGFGQRTRAFLRLSGPGYLQSAMTLGGGTAAASLFAGAAFGYSLLWVAPVAMLLGIVMLSAVSHQTLSTGVRPFEAMRRYAAAPLAYGWAIGALVASIVWHFPQYALGAAVLVDIGEVAGVGDLKPQWMGVIVLIWAIAISLMYGSTPRMMRIYERCLKYMVWGVLLCFGWVVLRTGISDWGALFRGFLAFEIPDEANGVAGLTVVLSGLSAAVGINMVFLFPYSQLARGWGREHRQLARFDLMTGMFLPYALAASLILIATANTIHQSGDFAGTCLAPIDAAQILCPAIGPTVGRIIFDVGILCMALSTITLHMLCCGFVCAEVFGWEVGGWKYRLATLLPTPGVLGPVLWTKLLWIAVPTNIVCGFLLPVVYIGFIRLQASDAYLGADRPRSAKGAAWLLGMIVATLVMIVFLGWFAITRGPGCFEQIGQLLSARGS
jgi:Mn2+/Fe2+ NRAMP family transporter